MDVGPGEAEGGLWGIRVVELTFNELTGGDLAVAKTCEPASGSVCRADRLLRGQRHELRTEFGPQCRAHGSLSQQRDVRAPQHHDDEGVLHGDAESAGQRRHRHVQSRPADRESDGPDPCRRHTRTTPQTVNDTATVTTESADPDPTNNEAHGSLVFIGNADLADHQDRHSGSGRCRDQPHLQP